MLQNAYLDAKIGVDTEEKRALQRSLILFNFHTTQRFNFRISIPPPLQSILAELRRSVNEDISVPQSYEIAEVVSSFDFWLFFIS